MLSSCNYGSAASGLVGMLQLMRCMVNAGSSPDAGSCQPGSICLCLQSGNMCCAYCPQTALSFVFDAVVFSGLNVWSLFAPHCPSLLSSVYSCVRRPRLLASSVIHLFVCRSTSSPHSSHTTRVAYMWLAIYGQLSAYRGITNLPVLLAECCCWPDCV